MTSLKVKFPVSLDCSGRGSEEETDQSENSPDFVLILHAAFLVSV